MLNVQKAKIMRVARAPKRMKEEVRRVLKPGASILGISSGVLLFDTGCSIDGVAQRNILTPATEDVCAANFFDSRAR